MSAALSHKAPAEHSMQVIYVSSRADEALLEALHEEPFLDAQHEPPEVDSQAATCSCDSHADQSQNFSHNARLRCPHIASKCPCTTCK